MTIVNNYFYISLNQLLNSVMNSNKYITISLNEYENMKKIIDDFVNKSDIQKEKTEYYQECFKYHENNIKRLKQTLNEKNAIIENQKEQLQYYRDSIKYDEDRIDKLEWRIIDKDKYITKLQDDMFKLLDDMSKS